MEPWQLGHVCQSYRYVRRPVANVPMTDEFVTMKEAQDELGVSNYTMWRMVRDGELTAYQSSLDRRRKMIRRADLDALRELRPIDRRKKAATDDSP